MAKSIDEIFREFDNGDKERLAQELKVALQLNGYLDIISEASIANMLGRDLTDGEKFKISVLKKTLSEFQAYASSNRFDEEEEEEMEEGI
jgi:hypothetical protein